MTFLLDVNLSPRLVDRLTKALILQTYDVMAAATEAGAPYQAVLDPPPARDRLHSER